MTECISFYGQLILGDQCITGDAAGLKDVALAWITRKAENLFVSPGYTSDHIRSLKPEIVLLKDVYSSTDAAEVVATYDYNVNNGLWVERITPRVAKVGDKILVHDSTSYPGWRKAVIDYAEDDGFVYDIHGTGYVWHENYDGAEGLGTWKWPD